MNKLLVFSLALSIFISLGYAQQVKLPPASHDPGMKAQFETLYRNWSIAMLRKDFKAWEKTVASYRRLETRNRIISQKLPFPQALFSDGISPPPLKNLIFLTVLTRGETASAIYFGKADFGVGDPGQVKNNLLVLRFIKDSDGEWRFDNTRIVTLGKDTSVLHNIRQQKFDFLQGEEFQPLGRVPSVAKPVPSPELLAEVWVSSIGYETEVWFNGHRTGRILNNQGRELVMGGIRKGNNQIGLRVRKAPLANVTPKFEIAVYAAEGSGKPAKRVFHFGPVEQVSEGEIKKAFVGQPKN